MDEAAFREIFETYYPDVLRLFRAKGLGKQDAEDLAQETFLKVHRGLPGLEQAAALRGWILRIAENLFRNFLRDRAASKRGPRELSLDQELETGEPAVHEHPQLGKHPPSPFAETLATEQEAILVRELEALPEQMGRCLALRVVRGLTYAEIAALLQISVNSVKSHIHQGRKRLEVRLEASHRPAGRDREGGAP